ncbi:long chain fatty alcohol oxidase [Lindgomyces ingoldianus]|uniref:Long chain fatty alcohol oxidase n=1 Tax=Lindgomyces ingoldianus TaxID=673940 RepID=A0ACB6QH38_9PLEO|nr:long chain fatty alcohol oxidase [Lindgomyces ingoldianus]KAF2466246.1 long chain fatty alcohol oxidase [Lindgomyces ingoldianus]
MSLTTAPVSPRATPLPPVPSEDPLTAAQWKTLLAIADTIIPAIKPIATANTRLEIPATANEYSTAISTLEGLSPNPDRQAAAKAYLEENASSNPAFREALHRLLALHMPHATKRQFILVLNILNTRAGSLLLTGSTTPIGDQPVHIREIIIQGWAAARLPLLRQLYRSLTMLSKQTWIRITPTLPRILGFPHVPLGMVPGKDFDYEFIQFPPGDKPEIIETDVVIVGSGCGGGVCAKNLAEAGNRVLVVEKAYHWTSEHYPMSQENGWDHLFMNGAFISSDDTAVNIIAGQAWGGGGTINWSASLQTQGFVRREWADRGLPFFTSSEFQDSLDRVCERMGVSAEFIEQNRTNQLLMEGARKLGYTYKAVPQNTGGKRHHCGHCTFGCGSGEKQGPSVSYLPDAARAGAKFIEGFHAEKIIFSQKNGEKVAIGVRGTWVSRDVNGGVAGEPITRRKVIIKAKRVIVSAGAMQSPLLLLRSGLKNSHIGRNLYIHPVSLLGAIHKEDIKPWEGAILTSVVSECENLDGKGHGVKLEATNMLPSAWLIWLPWKSGLDYKLNAARMKHMVGYISLARDRDTGQVYPDPVDGRVRFKYSTSSFDKKHITEGLIALAKMQYVTGATEIFTVIPGVSTFIRSAESEQDGVGINDAKFQAWLEEVRTVGFPSPESMFVSAHQMGTCRMSSTAKTGVVDPKGQVWGTKGLYVADASVFPSASGVNPMVTNMAIADWLSRGVATGLVNQARL